jgi:hypothetical protein
VFKSIVGSASPSTATAPGARSVRRSNGYKALESRALESVKRAAPFAAPAFTIRRADGSVQFLETFLFRNDGRFRILSLQQA